MSEYFKIVEPAFLWTDGSAQRMQHKPLNVAGAVLTGASSRFGQGRPTREVDIDKKDGGAPVLALRGDGAVLLAQQKEGCSDDPLRHCASRNKLSNPPRRRERAYLIGRSDQGGRIRECINVKPTGYQKFHHVSHVALPSVAADWDQYVAPGLSVGILVW
jgi:hypothetical protein